MKGFLGRPGRSVGRLGGREPPLESPQMTVFNGRALMRAEVVTIGPIRRRAALSDTAVLQIFTVRTVGRVHASGDDKNFDFFHRQLQIFFLDFCRSLTSVIFDQHTRSGQSGI